jgi:hypothetical protein
MIRSEARALGYDVDDLPAVDRPGDDELTDEDIVNVWEQLPNAESIPLEDEAEYGEIGTDAPTDAEVHELTQAVDEAVAAGELPEPDVQVSEVSDA